MKKTLSFIILLIISTIIAKTQFIVADVDINDVSCNGELTGEVTISVTGGTGPYNYYLIGGGSHEALGVIDTFQTFSGLSARVYTVLVEQSIGPNVVDLIEILEPDPVSITSATFNPITCTGLNDGKINVTATGESGSLTYTLNPGGLDQPVGLFAALSPGNYTVTVSDGGGCSSFDTSPVLSLVDPMPISIQSESSQDITCFGDGNGEIDVKAQGGTAPYIYTLNPLASQVNDNGFFNGLVQGIYTVEVTDVNNCSPKTSSGLAVLEPAELIILTENAIDVSCNGDTDGSVVVTAGGGSGSYIYTLSGGGGSNITGSFNNLTPGTYTVTIMDSKGCGPVVSSNLVVGEPAPLSVSSLSSENISCFNYNDGNIDIKAAGGTAPYNYTLSNGDISISGDFPGLSAGLYTVDITDSKACPVFTSNPVNIVNPPAISLLSESTKEITCFEADNAEIHVKGQGGTGDLHYTLSPDGSITNMTGDFTGILPGTYNVGFTDDNLCPAGNSGPHTFLEPTPIIASANASSKLILNCLGDSDGTIDLDVSGGTGPYLYSWSGPAGFTSSSKNLTNLLPGTYSVMIRDANLCSETIDIATVSEPPKLELSLDKTDVICNGDADGTISVTPAGGTPLYLYSKNGITYQASSLFSNLSENLYTIYIKDSKDCINNDTISITEPLKLWVAEESRADNNLCYGDSLGEISIDLVTGGVKDYEYSIDGGVNYTTNSLFSNLPADTYATAVRDQNGCVAFGNAGIIINQPDSLKILNLIPLNVSQCYGKTNGQIFIEATGGTSTKKYSLDGGPFINPGNFTNVGGGTHEITIIDLNLCEKKTSVLINEPPELIFTNIDQTDITDCFGDATGKITADVSGGTGAGTYDYAIDGGAFTPVNSFSALQGGEHNISVKDANGCPLDTIITISQPQELSVFSTTPVDVSCTGANDGKITIVAEGGTGSYNYSLNPGALNNITGIFENLSPDSYTISITDSKACGPILSGSIDISEPLPIILESLNSTEIICNGDNNAGISLAVSGGIAPIEYSIDDESNYVGTSDFTNLSPATYYISAKDAQNCVLYIDTLTFSDPLPILLNNQTISDVNGCYNEKTGSIKYELSGGVGVIEYSIDTGINWQVSPEFLSLGSGDYRISAIDERGCEQISPEFSITQPQEITADIISTRYYSPTKKGKITINNATGGTGTLEYSINGTTGTFSAETFYENLEPGSYDVVVKDANDCKYEETINITAVPPLIVSFSKRNVTCHGDVDGSIILTPENATGQVQFSIDDSASWQASGTYDPIGPGEYSVYVKDEENRYFHVDISVVEPNVLSILSNVTSASCSSNSGDGAIEVTIVGSQGIVNYNWSNGSTAKDLNNINGGFYTLDIIDEKFCTASKEIEVPGVTFLEANPGPDTTVCTGSEYILNGQGGTTVSWSPVSGLSNPNIPNPVATIDSTITYTLMVSGQNDCFDIDSITISTYPELGLDAGNDTSVYESGTVEINIIGGPFTSYSWLPTTGIDDPTSSNVIITPSQTSTYIVSAIDENGCLESDTLVISMVDNILVYNSFSPDGDGINDYWDIDNADFYPKILVEVYNRWGEKLFSTTGYTSDKRWDGTYKGKNAPIGTYYYVIVPYRGATAITGPLTIVR
jgi:gliding motility-associated-like protein